MTGEEVFQQPLETRPLCGAENGGSIEWALLQRIKRAAHADAGMLCRVQIDFRRGNIRMPKQSLLSAMAATSLALPLSSANCPHLGNTIATPRAVF